MEKFLGTVPLLISNPFKYNNNKIKKGGSTLKNRLAIDKEFKELIPPLLEEEYRQLEQNILAKGKCLNPIILWDGIIVDGHNRFYICIEHGIEFEVEEMEFGSREEAKLWIIKNQLGRRNLTDAARIELAMSKAELLRTKARERQSRAGGDKYGNETLSSESSKVNKEPVDVRKMISKEAGVGEYNLSLYKQIKEQGSPALLEAVKIGKLKIGTAHRMLPRQIEKQLKEVDKMYEYIEKHLPLVKGEELKAQLNHRFVNLANQLHALLEMEEVV